MRFTLEPFGDLEVTEGATLGECRADLARLTGTPPTTPLGIAGVVLTEDQVAGVPPWVAGARIESEPGRTTGPRGNGPGSVPAGGLSRSMRFAPAAATRSNRCDEHLT